MSFLFHQGRCVSDRGDFSGWTAFSRDFESRVCPWKLSLCQYHRRGSSDIDEMIIVLLGRMMVLYNSEWTIFKITALSAPYSTIFCHARPSMMTVYGSMQSASGRQCWASVSKPSRFGRLGDHLSHNKLHVTSVVKCLLISYGKWLRNESGQWDLKGKITAP
jgi:hypothetical protein